MVRAPLTFEEYFSQFTLGMMGWFRSELPRARDLTTFHYLSIWGFIALAIILLFLLARKARVFSPLVASTLGFGLIYTLALFGNALISYFNRLWGRFQLPFYFPLIVLFLVVIAWGCVIYAGIIHAPIIQWPLWALCFLLSQVHCNSTEPSS